MPASTTTKKSSDSPDSLESLMSAVNGVAQSQQPNALKLIQIADLTSKSIDPATDSIAGFVNQKAKQELAQIQDNPAAAFESSTPATKTLNDLLKTIVSGVKGIF